MNLQKNDLIELGYGSTCVELVRVLVVEDLNVICLNLSNGEKISIKINELYLKEDITKQRMCPKYEEQLNKLGAKNLWVRLTRMQYKKINKQIESCESIKNIDDKQIEKLKKWFLENKEEKKENYIKIFDLKEKEKETNAINIFGSNTSSPLSRFIKKSI